MEIFQRVQKCSVPVLYVSLIFMITTCKYLLVYKSHIFFHKYNYRKLVFNDLIKIMMWK